jgi:hypothetical protein
MDTFYFLIAAPITLLALTIGGPERQGRSHQGRANPLANFSRPADNPAESTVALAWMAPTADQTPGTWSKLTGAARRGP